MKIRRNGDPTPTANTLDLLTAYDDRLRLQRLELGLAGLGSAGLGAPYGGSRVDLVRLDQFHGWNLD